MKAWKAPVEIRPWPEGGYIAEVPALQGCWVIGETAEEALRDIHEAIEMSIESRLECDEPLPPELEEVREGAQGELRVEVAVALTRPRRDS